MANRILPFLLPCSSLLSVAVINIMIKGNLGRKAIVWLTFPCLSHSWREAKLERKQIWNLETETMEKRPFFGLLSCTKSSDGTAHSELGPPTFVIKKLPQMEAIFTCGSPLSRWFWFVSRWLKIISAPNYRTTGNAQDSPKGSEMTILSS